MYKRSKGGWTKHWDFILIDTICLQISFILGYYLRYRSFFAYSKRNPYRTTTSVLLLLSILVAIIFNTMHNVLKRSIWEEIKSTVIQCGLVFAGIITILFSAKDSNHVSRIVMYLATILYALTAFITRIIYKKLLVSRITYNPKRVMLLVGDEKGEELARAAFKMHPEEGIDIKYVVRVDEKGTGDVELDSAAEFVKNEWIDEVYIAVSDPALIPFEFIHQCSEMAVTVHRQIVMAEDINDHPWIEKIAKQPVLTTSISMPQLYELFLKRTADIFSGLFISLLAIVVLIIFTPIIKLMSPGPILLKRVRIGRHGRKFMMYTIRTMYMDAADREDKVIKGIGKFMRRWSLDQLPKGFNVLLGDMSLVGTRAPSVEEWEGYKYHHRARLACKPGITGLFQVCKPAGVQDISFDTATSIDTEFITNWSILLDLKILFAPGALRRKYSGRMTEVK